MMHNVIVKAIIVEEDVVLLVIGQLFCSAIEEQLYIMVLLEKFRDFSCSLRILGLELEDTGVFS